MVTKTNESTKKAEQLAQGEYTKPSLQEQIDFILEHIEGSESDIKQIEDSVDEGSSHEERQGFIKEMNAQLDVYRAILENLIAVRIWNSAEARRAEPVTDKNKVGILLASNIDSQIIYIDAYILELRRNALADYRDWMEHDMAYSLNILNTLKMTKWFVRSITDELTAMPSNQPTNINEDIAELVGALQEAKKNIRTWHGMGMPEQAERNTWLIYERQSPEMKRLNTVLEKYTELEVSNG